MGLFGEKTEILVAATAYNMAGDVEDRIEYLKSLIGSNIISNSKFSMTDSIQSGYLNGPGIQGRSFYRWALNHYNDIGVPQLVLGRSLVFDTAAIQAQIPHASNEAVEILDVIFGAGSASYFADQWVLANFPERISTNWKSDYNRVTEQIVITWADGTTSAFAFNLKQIAFNRYYHITYIVKDLNTQSVSTRMWIYRVGDGNTVLDGIPTTFTDSSKFFPYIPVRIENKFLSESYEPEAYALSKKAYKKATHQKFDKLVDQLKDNESLDDIDHAFVVWGCSLNSRDRACRRYIFKLFELLKENSQADYTQYMSFKEALAVQRDKYIDYDTKRKNWWTKPQPGTVDPAYELSAPAYPASKPYHELRLVSPSASPLDAKMDSSLIWYAINEITGTGLLKPDAKKGDCWFSLQADDDMGSGSIQLFNRSVTYNKPKANVIDLNWQIDNDHWKTLRIYGLQYQNYVYGNKAVTITAREAMEETDDSPFIVPLHYETLRQMSLIDSTQLLTCSTYLVLNSYKIVKQKWYQTTFFKVLMVVAIIAITVATGGAGSVGLLGTNMAVGTALGFTGLTAIVVGAIANALAAMILMQLISLAATEIFGAKIGAIVTVIVSVIAMQVGTGLLNGQSLSSVWGNMMSAPNIIQMTSAVGNGIAGYVQASTQEFMNKTQKLLENYEKQSADITNRTIEEFGYGKFLFDNSNLFENKLTYEPSDAFLVRTLMTGSDVAEMSLDMLTNFADLTLNLQL